LGNESYLKLDEEEEKEIEELKKLIGGLKEPYNKTKIINIALIISILGVIVLGFCSFIYPYFLLESYKKNLLIYFPNLETEIAYYLILFITENPFLPFWIASIVCNIIYLILKLKIR